MSYSTHTAPDQSSSSDGMTPDNICMHVTFAFNGFIHLFSVFINDDSIDMFIELGI